MNDPKVLAAIGKRLEGVEMNVPTPPSGAAAAPAAAAAAPSAAAPEVNDLFDAAKYVTR
jgi:hypothetical protein